MSKIVSFVENLLTEKTFEVAVGAASTAWLASHNVTTTAVAALVAVLGSLGVHVGGALSASSTPPAAPPAAPPVAPGA